MKPSKADRFLRQLQKPGRFKLFLLFRLPLAFVAGLRLEEADRMQARISLKLSYFTKNPFRSIYFAALSMAGEMSTGMLGFMYAQAADRKVSMLLIHQEGDFTKKATGRIAFACEQGADIQQAIATAVATDEPQTVDAQSIGYNAAGEEVARFTFRWSYKAKAN